MTTKTFDAVKLMRELRDMLSQEMEHMTPEEQDGRLAGGEHGLSFEEAATAFADPLSLTIPDPDHSQDEDRFVLVGETIRGKVVVVVHTERGARR